MLHIPDWMIVLDLTFYRKFVLLVCSYILTKPNKKTPSKSQQYFYLY